MLDTLDIPRSDEDTRAVINYQLSHNIYLEAGAGTGKTSSLVDRVVALIESGVDLDKIVAITFTRAAASELKIRIREKLEELNHTDTLQEIDSAAFQTIDSLVLSILREYAIEAGLPPDVSIQDETIEMEKLKDAWQPWLVAMLDEETEFADSLERAIMMGMTNPMTRLRNLAEMIRSSHISRTIPRVERTALAAIAKLRALAQDLTRIQRSCTDSGDKLCKEIRAILSWYNQHIADQNPNTETEAEKLLESHPRLYRTTNLGSQAFWPGGAIAEARETLNQFQTQIKNALENARLSIASGLVHSVAEFEKSMMERRRREGTPTYEDAIIWTLHLLENDPSIRKDLSDRYSHILVDEFQDTDPLQVRLINMLTSSHGETSHRAGSLFVVGDPKQSIYRFRGAEVTVSQKTGQQIKEDSESGIWSTLVENHRSLPRIIEWVNTVFKAWMQSESEDSDKYPAQAEWIDLEPDRSFKHPGRVYHFGWVVDANVDDVREMDAKDVAKIAAAICEGAVMVRDEKKEGQLRPSRPGDLAIITRKRTSWDIYRRELDRLQIPYIAEGESASFNPQEFRDLLNCLTAIDDPTHQPATVGALRSVFFGCSDLELQEWATRGGKFSLAADTPQDAESSPVAIALDTLRKYHRIRDFVPFSIIMEQLIRECQVRESAYLDRQSERAASLRRLDLAVELARQFEAEGAVSLRDCVKRLQSYPETLQHTREEPRSNRSISTARITTIHTAKGLEFPIVIMADLCGEDKVRTEAVEILSSYSSLSEEQEIAFRIGVTPRPNRHVFTVGRYKEMKDVEKHAQKLEFVRDYYVAATRARDVLIVSRYRKTKENKDALALVKKDGTPSSLMEMYANPKPHISRPIPDEWYETEYKPAETQRPTSVATQQSRDKWIQDHQSAIDKASSRAWFTPSGLKAHTHGAIQSPADEKSDDIQYSDSETPTPRGRAATAIGSAVHAAVQRILEKSHLHPSEIARQEAANHDIPESAEEVQNLTDATMQMPLLQKVRKMPSDSFWIEAPVSTSVQLHNGESKLLEGRVDLIYRLEDGSLGIADFKTDTSFDRSIDEMAQPYIPQLGGYAHAVQQTTGIRVSEARLLFSRLAAENPDEAEYRIPDIETATQQALLLASDQSYGSDTPAR